MQRTVIYCFHFILFTAVVPYVIYLLAVSIEALAGFTSSHPPAYAQLVLGSVLVFMGLVIMLRAEVDMYKHSDGTPFPFYNPPKKLVRNGIYACTRNPMYLGTTLEYCGLGLVLNRLLMIPMALATLGLAMSLYFMHEKPKMKRLNQRDAAEYLSTTPLLIPKAKCLKHAFLNRKGSRAKPVTERETGVSRS